METTFTKAPFPAEPSETSWKDSVNWAEEYEKEWTGDPKLALPERKVNYHYERVPEWEDEDFDWHSAVAGYNAKAQRIREQYIINAEVIDMQKKIRSCFYTQRVNFPRLCRPMVMEYLRRLNCLEFNCNYDERPTVAAPKKKGYFNQNSKEKAKWSGEFIDIADF